MISKKSQTHYFGPYLPTRVAFIILLTFLTCFSSVNAQNSKSASAVPDKRKQTAATNVKSSSEIADSIAYVKGLAPRVEKNFKGLDKAVEEKISNTVVDALAGIDWGGMARQVDTVIKDVSTIGWMTIEKEITQVLSEADRALRDPKLKEDIKREIATTRKDIAAVTKTIYSDGQRGLDEAKRGLELSRRELEQVKKEIQAERVDAERTRNDVRE